MYDSDVTDEQWELIQSYFERRDTRGAVSKHSKRSIVNAIFYMTKTGCQWRYLAGDYPPWKTVYDHYRNWNRRSVWEEVLDQLNEKHRKKTIVLRGQVMPLLTRKA